IDCPLDRRQRRTPPVPSGSADSGQPFRKLHLDRLVAVEVDKFAQTIEGAHSLLLCRPGGVRPTGRSAAPQDHVKGVAERQLICADPVTERLICETWRAGDT